MKLKIEKTILSISRSRLNLSQLNLKKMTIFKFRTAVLNFLIKWHLVLTIETQINIYSFYNAS